MEEMKSRFAIFSENLDLIRSTNKKGLSYTLGVNRELLLHLLSVLLCRFILCIFVVIELTDEASVAFVCGLSAIGFSIWCICY